MKYALFVLGILLIAFGGYFIHAGSNIIEVERGWSSVIAGTTALTGGIITLGLACVVKSLDNLYRLGAAGVPKRQAATAPAGAAPSPAESSETVLAQGPVPAGVETAPLPPDITFAAAEPTPAAPDIFPTSFTARLTPKYSPPPIPADPSPGIAELRQRVAENLNLDIEGLDPQPPEPLEAITPPPLDFLDFDVGETASEDHFDPEQINPAESTYASETPPLSAEMALSPTEAAKPGGKAIGRYEADGTIYVMFADGSIDAQSAQDTRHFNSMAELKASFQSKT